MQLPSTGDIDPVKPSWQIALSHLITTPEALLAALSLSPALLPAAKAAAKQFPLKVTHSFLARIEKGNPNDPLLKQILPLDLELIPMEGYHADPLQERAMNPIPGLLHKYQSRVLVTLTSACAVHCRYCFRREFPYEDNKTNRAAWSQLFDYIKADANINEVILSGGDPMTVNDPLLHAFTNELQQLPQIKRLRIHTRTLIVLPSRVTDSLLHWFSSLSVKPIVVLHVNHPNEINDEVEAALKALRSAHVTLLNQSVLLRGVNDEVSVLTALSERLFEAGVLPYYLHTLDKVQGAHHFDLPLTTAKTLHAELKKTLPGFLVPKLVVEKPGEPSKSWL